MTKESLTFQRLSNFYLENNVSDSVIQNLIQFNQFLKSLTPSKNTHYDKLDKWSNPVYEYIHNLLDKYQFVNGNVEANSKNPNALFLFEVYKNLECYSYSPFYAKENCAIHHASAAGRNNALIEELDYFLSKIPELETIKTEKSI